MYPEPNKPEFQPFTPTYSPADTAYAWISLVAAFLFCQSLPVASYPLGGFLLIGSLFLSAFVILRIKKIKLSPVCSFSALSSLVIASALLLTNTVFLINLSFAYSLASYCYFLYAAFGNRIEEGFSDYVYIDYLRALFVYPFRSFGAIFSALASSSARKISGVLVKVLLGFVVAVIPTCLVFLFLAYDPDFLNILDDIFSFDLDRVSRTVRSLFFTLPLAMYGFGLYASSLTKDPLEKVTAEDCEARLEKMKILPQLTALVAVLPILFLYGVYFVSQWKYYVSGFTGVLPQDFSYADYARQGFFELCCVSVINLLLIVGIAFLMKRGKNGSGVILKIVATLFCLCTLILISTAVAKLVMYIDYYGLTPKRVYAMWLMALIAIVFLLIALGQFLRKCKVVALCVTVAIVMFAALAVCNVGAICAQYNADRYLSGTLETFDAGAMSDLGDSAIPALVQVATEMDKEKDPHLHRRIEAILQVRAEKFQHADNSLFAFSIPAARAKAALKRYGLTCQPSD